MCSSVDRNLIHIPNEYHSFAPPGQDKLYKHGFSCNIGAGDGTVDRMRKQKVVYKANKSLRLRILVIPSQSFLLVHNVHIKLIIEFLL